MEFGLGEGELQESVVWCVEINYTCVGHGCDWEVHMLIVRFILRWTRTCLHYIHRSGEKVIAVLTVTIASLCLSDSSFFLLYPSCIIAKTDSIKIGQLSHNIIITIQNTQDIICCDLDAMSNLFAVVYPGAMVYMHEAPC